MGQAGVPQPHLAALNLLPGKEGALTCTSPHLSFPTSGGGSPRAAALSRVQVHRVTW